MTNQNIAKRAAGLMLAAVMALTALNGCGAKDDGINGDRKYNRELMNVRLTSLWDAVSADDALVLPEGDVTVFLSVCNKTEQASVVHGTAESLEAAWKEAEAEAYSLVEKKPLMPLWVKADVVINKETYQKDVVERDIGQTVENCYRVGLALDPGLETAFLEAECNANGLYNYKDGAVSTEALKRYSGKSLSVPDELTLFVTQGYFCGTDNITHKLSANRLDFGVRDAVLNADTAQVLVNQSAQYLLSQLNADGSFNYGYYAHSGSPLSGYNALRHIVAIWPMLKVYEQSPSEELAYGIDSAINYMITKFVRYRSDGAAFILDPTQGELKLGGGAVAASVLIDYQEIFGTDRHNDLILALGEGILAMGDPDSGTFEHVWNEEFDLLAEYRTTYYDTEATYALCRLYGYTPDMRYINMARAAVDRFIAEDSIKEVSQWLSYTLNELTKYDPSPKYYELAFRNVQDNLSKIENAPAPYHTRNELLGAAYETYRRAVDTDAQVPYLENTFEKDRFFAAIEDTAKNSFSAFGFPEVVMYFENPAEMYGCFFVRTDAFRSRIDDVQHFAFGYLGYLKYAELEHPAA